MIVLSIDTAQAACSVCVLDAKTNKPLAHISEPMQTGHAERLSDMVKQALSDSHIEFRQVDRLAACSGPGTFTGVRIGLAFVRSLALVLKTPVIGITTMQAIAERFSHRVDAGEVWVVQDARRGEVYIQGFDASGAELHPAAAMSLHDAETLLAGRTGLLTGTGVALIRTPDTMQLVDEIQIDNSLSIARLAARADATLSPPEPIYLRAPDAKAQTPLVRHQVADISIEKVTLEASKELSHIHKQCFDQGWEEASINSLLATPGTVALLAIDNEVSGRAPCGFTLLRSSGDELEILTLAVLPQKRRRKVGSVLMNAIRDHAREEGIPKIFIEYEDGNDAAANLYKSAGYDCTGRRKNYYRHNDGTVNDAITARLIVTV